MRGLVVLGGVLGSGAVARAAPPGEPLRLDEPLRLREPTTLRAPATKPEATKPEAPKAEATKPEEPPKADAPPAAEGTAGKRDSKTPFKCVRTAELERAATIAAQTAFKPSSIPLGPLFWASADRTFMQAAMVYWNYVDLEDDSRLTLLFPFFMKYCSAEADLFVTPLGGYRRDAAGSAGLALNYYFRRDGETKSDVVFPFFWSLRERERSTLVALNTFHVRRGTERHWGFAPLYFGGATPTSRYDLVPPALFARWRDGDAKTTIAGPYYDTEDEGSHHFGVAPLYFGGRRADGSGYDAAPLALTGHWFDQQRDTFIAGPFYRHSHPGGWSAGLAPLYFGGRDGKSYYDVAPAALFLRFGDEASRTTIAGPYYDTRDRHAHAFGVAPLYMGARTAAGTGYDFAPLLLTGRWFDREEDTLIAGPFYRHTRQDGWFAGLAPFYFGKHTAGSYYDLAIPPLFMRWGDAERSRTIAGPYYDVRDKDQHDFGVAPFYFGERKASGSGFDLVPLALTAHTFSREHDTLVVGPFYRHSRAGGWSGGLAPFYFGGRNGDAHYDLVLPPLFMRWGDARSELTVAGPYYDSRSRFGHAFGVAPLYFGARDDDGTGYDVVPLALTGRWYSPVEQGLVAGPFYRHTRSDGWSAGLAPLYFGGRAGASYYDLAPAALFLRFGDAATQTTVAGPYYSRRDGSGHAFGVAPLYFGGREKDGTGYDVVPLALTAHWFDREHDTTLAGTFYRHSRPDGWSAGLAPFYFGGRTGASYYDVVPAGLFLRVGDAATQTTVAGPYYSRTDARGHSFGLAPLYFGDRSKDGTGYDVLPLALTAHWYDRAHDSMFAGPFYRHTRPDGWSAGLAPLYFGARTGSSYFDTVPAALFLRYGDAQSSTTLAGPYYDVKDERAHSFGVAPFYLGGRNAAGSGYDLVPLALVAHVFDREHDTLVAGPFYRHAHPGGWSGGLAPLYFGSRDRGTYHDLVVPPLFMRWGNESRSRLVAGTYYDLRDSGGHTFGAAPLYFGERNTDGTGYDVVPLALTAHWFDKGHDTVLAGPFYRHSRPDGWSAGLAPFYFGGRTGASYYDAVPAALFLRFGDGQKSTTIAGPYYDRKGPGAHGFGVAPFYLGARDDDGTGYDLVPLALTAHWFDRERDTTLAGPFYRHTRPDGWSAGLAPLYFGGRTGPSYYDTVPAALFLRYGDAASSTTIAGPYYAHRDPPGRSFGVAPLYFGGRDTAGAGYDVAPLALTAHWFDRDRDTLIAGPFYRRSDAAGWAAGLAPFYFGGRSAGGSGYDAVPLALTAHWFDRERDTLIAGPFYRHAGPGGWSAGLAPFYFGGRHGDSYYDVAPLFVRVGDASSSTTVAGTYYDRKDAGGHAFGVAPFYLGNRTTDGRGYDAVPLALTAHWFDREHDTTLAGPFYRRTRPGGWSAGLAPLYFGERNQDGTGYDAVPLALTAHWFDREHDTTLAGPFYRHSRPGGWSAGLAPLYFGERDARGTGYDVVPLALTAHWYRPGEDTLVAGPFYRNARPGGWSAGLAPLYFGGRDGASYYDIATPLFMRWGDAASQNLVAGTYYDHQDQDGHDFGLAPLYFGGRGKGGTGYDTVPLALTAHWFTPERDTVIAGPFYRHSRPDGWSAGLAPFYFGGRTRSSYYDVAAPLFLRFGDTESSTTVAGTYYSHRDRDGHDFGVAPFYFGGRNASGGGYDAVPLALTAHWFDKGYDTTIAGPFYRHTRPDGWSAGLAPFYFGGRSGTSSYDIAAPFYASWKSPESKTTVVLTGFSHSKENGDFKRGVMPLYYESRTHDEYLRMMTPLAWQWGDSRSDHTLVIPALTYASREADRRLVVAPLVYHQSDKTTSDTVAFPFYWHFRRPTIDATVVSGLYWDFKWPEENKRLQVAPGFMRWDRPQETTYLAGPVSWSSGKGSKLGSWSFHVAPLVSVWKNHPDHLKWRALFWCFGYEREYERKQYTYLWAIKTDPGPPSPAGNVASSR